MEPERTIRVVGVSVEAGGIPALDGPIHPPAEDLLSRRTHGQTQHSSAGNRVYYVILCYIILYYIILYYIATGLVLLVCHLWARKV